MTVKFKMKPTRVVGLTYAHSPKRQGASHDGVTEHELSIKWIDQIQMELAMLGIPSVLAPKGGLTKKINFLNKSKVDVGLELHFNSNINVKGSETLYCPGSNPGRRLAQCVHAAYSPWCCNRDRGTKEGWYRMDKPGVVDYPGDVDGDESMLAFLRKTNFPAIILEPEFIYNVEDINNMQDVVCKHIARGIFDYLRLM